MEKMTELNSSFSKHAASEFTCPGCGEFLVPPIFQCFNGHNICNSCVNKLPSCPCCQQFFTEVRNRALEKLAEHYTVSCPNGCGEKCRLLDWRKHELNCPEREYRCKMHPCTWKGKLVNLVNHVNNSHPKHIFKFGLGKLNRLWKGDFVKLAILKEKELFWYHLIQDSSIRKFYRTFQYIGPINKAHEYRYSFVFELPDKKTKINFSQPCLSLNDDIDAKYTQDVDFHGIMQYVSKRWHYPKTLQCETHINLY